MIEEIRRHNKAKEQEDHREYNTIEAIKDICRYYTISQIKDYFMMIQVIKNAAREFDLTEDMIIKALEKAIRDD
jgi:hypothetical protein